MSTQPDTAIVESVVSPQITEGGPGTFARSNSASAAAAGVAGVLGEATKGFAGWAVTSLATRVSSILLMAAILLLSLTILDVIACFSWRNG
jgi:hypothetical protein